MSFLSAHTIKHGDQYIHCCVRDGKDEARLNGRVYRSLTTAKREATLIDVRFFFKHAGWRHNPATETTLQGRWKSAKALASAEKSAKAAGMVFEWRDDHRQGDEPDDVERVEWCGVKSKDGEPITSLGAIWDASPEYCRVVQAELAMEALLIVEMA